MGDEPLQRLLQQLSGGDPEAAEQVFRTYEPYLRKVVRRQLPARLRVKFDSIDVVQSVWADVLKGLRQSDWRFESVAQLRAFLVRATRNRFIDRVRQHDVVLAHEDAVPAGDLARTCAAPSAAPSENAQAGELWERMLTLCPPDHQKLLELRRQGYTLEEIAARTGMHEGSVRRVLRTLARQLAFRPPPDIAPVPPDATCHGNSV